MSRKASKRLAIAASLLLQIAFAAICPSAQATVTRDDNPSLSKGLPAYCWQDDSVQARAVAIAVHGLTMHGGTFEVMARELATRGVIVLAPDLRGYGRWQNQPEYQDSAKDPLKIDYDTSYADLIGLVKATKSAYPNLPLYCIGESLGAALALRVAGDLPGTIDGLVLSAPAVKRHSFYGTIIGLSGPIITSPAKQLDLIPLIRKFASEDPLIVEAAVNDPLVRKRMSPVELYRTIMTVKPALDWAKKVPPTTAVLVIQGAKDRMVQSRGIVELLAELRSTDQTVRWFSNRGHVLLETSRIRPDTLATVEGWLTQRLPKTDILQMTELSSTARLSHDGLSENEPAAALSLTR